MYAFPRILSNLSFKNQGQSRAQALMMTSLRVAIIALLQRWVPAAEVFFLDYTEGWFPVQPLLGTPCRLLQLPQNHFQLVEKSSLVMSIFFFLSMRSSREIELVHSVCREMWARGEVEGFTGRCPLLFQVETEQCPSKTHLYTQTTVWERKKENSVTRYVWGI